MNKIVFPALLAATIMIAGAFAFVPVEQASTVHNTILAEISGISNTSGTSVILDGVTIGYPGLNGQEPLVLASAATAGNTIEGVVCLSTTVMDGNLVSIEVTTSDNTVQVIDTAVPTSNGAPTPTCKAFAGQNLQVTLFGTDSNSVGDAAIIDGVISFTERTATVKRGAITE